MPPSPSSPVPPPDGLVEALGGIGLELTEAAHGRRWLAQAPDGRRSVVTVLAPPTPERAERMRARLLLVRRLAHPHLAAPTDVIELPGGAMAVLHAEVPGTDLRRLQGARGRWAAGEVVTVLVPLGRALAALHEAGLVHGDVSMANVVLDQHGRPVLIDVVSGADPEEQGTPGYAAPERERGATPAADVYALAMMGLRLLGPEDGEPAPPEETTVRQQLMGLLRTATATDPTERPTAAELADAVYALTSAAPVTMPDAAVLAGLVLRQNAVPDPEEITRLRQPVARGRHRRSRTVRTPALVAATTASLLLCAGQCRPRRTRGADFGAHLRAARRDGDSRDADRGAASARPGGGGRGRAHIPQGACPGRRRRIRPGRGERRGIGGRRG